MNDVYLKNRTSSAITVAGYTVHYMDKTDAEIVEVEGVENITRSDDASGTISAITLPTAHSYTGVSFDSLRYYAKGVVSESEYIYNAYGYSSAWYGGKITWFDSSLGDLSDKLFTTGTPDRTTSRVKQTILRVLLITDNGINGYPVWDTDYNTVVGQISNYTYNNGQHSLTLWFSNIGGDWTTFAGAGRIMIRFLDGSTTFNGLDSFDLLNVSSGVLSKLTATDRYDMYNVWNNSITIHAQYSVQNQVKYNAFKYLLSSVPYWYVIDGVQADWTDDLASIGYSEVQPVVPLPTVSIGGDFGSYNWLYATNGGSVWSISANSSLDLWNSTGSGYVKVSYDSSKAYAAIMWYSGTGVSDKGENGTLSVLNNSGYIAAKNETSSSVTLYAIRCAVCSSADATVVHVYDKATGVAYNAFKYTLEGTDYYYILDGTQSDWVDDIDSLEFALGDGFTEITLYLASGSKRCQLSVSSSFTGNVDSEHIYQLYTDEQCTTPWTGYDYSNDYEVGHYVNGEWNRYTDSVSEMPSSTAIYRIGYILMDTGFLWLCCNDRSSTSVTITNIVVRIYPKGQQWIPVFPYNPFDGEYDNLSTARKGTFVRMGSPATVFGTFPAIAESSGYKSGMIKSASIQAELQISQAELYINVAENPALSNIIVRFENDICTGYVRSDKADLPTAPSYDGATYTLKDDDGNNIDYDDSFTYKFVLLLKSTGDTAGGTYSTGAMIKSSTGKLQVRIRASSSKFNRVWYYRIPIS